MKLIEPVINYINQTLASGKLNGYRFQQGQWYGMATAMAGTDEDGKVEYYIESGGQDITPDDTDPFMIYHRCTGVVFGPPDRDKQYGDGSPMIKASYNMKLVCFADAEKIKMNGNDLAFLIYAGMPHKIKLSDLTELSGLGSVSLLVKDAQTDVATVFKGEFSVPYPGQIAQSTLIAVNYSVEIQADRTCLSCQDCNN